MGRSVGVSALGCAARGEIRACCWCLRVGLDCFGLGWWCLELSSLNSGAEGKHPCTAQATSTDAPRASARRDTALVITDTPLL